MKRYSGVLILAIIIVAVGCASTVSERGKEFVFKKEVKIIPGETTKKVILESYGEPTQQSMQGKYQILDYYYGREALSHGRAIGQGVLGAATFGLSDLATDHGVKNSDIKREFREMKVYVDPMTSVVKDFYYHDSDSIGQDESETLYLKATQMRLKGSKIEEITPILEKSISLNPNNHRALNSLAWTLIDNNLDLEKGIKLAVQAVNIFPESPYNNGTLGIGYLKNKDLDNAEKYLQIAVDLFPIYSPRDQRAIQNDRAYLMQVKQLKNANK